MCKSNCWLMSIFAVLVSLALISNVNGQERSRARGESTSLDKWNEDRLASRVFARIAASGSLAGSNIRITVNGSTVSLYGVVADEESKKRAGQIVARVRSVENVVNNLEIDAVEIAKRRNLSIGDDLLAKQIAEKLVRDLFPRARVERDWIFGWEVEGDSFEFEVNVDGRDVTLSGGVARPEIIDEIIRSVHSIPGVRSVHSELQANTFARPYREFPPWGYYPYPFSLK